MYDSLVACQFSNAKYAEMPHKYCSYLNDVCTATDKETGSKHPFHHVPNHPPVLKPDATLERKWRNHAVKCLRLETLRRLGYTSYTTSRLHFCRSHPLEESTHRLHLQHNGATQWRTYVFTVPIHFKKIKAHICQQQHLVCQGKQSSKIVTTLLKGPPLPDKKATNKTALSAMMEKLFHEVNESDGPVTLFKLNEYECVAGNEEFDKIHEFEAEIPTKTVSCHKLDDLKCKETTPLCTPKSLDNDTVRNDTGFPTLFSMLAYVLILFNAELSVLTEKTSFLTWFEEW